MLDKLREKGVNVDLIQRIPSGFLSILMIFFVLIAGVTSNNWSDFIIYTGMLVAWMIGVFFGFKVLLNRMQDE